MWEGGSFPYTTSEHCRSALVQPRHPYICEVAPFSLEQNRAVRSKESRRVHDECRLKNVVKEHENKPKTKSRQDFYYKTGYYSCFTFFYQANVFDLASMAVYKRGTCAYIQTFSIFSTFRTFSIAPHCSAPSKQ